MSKRNYSQVLVTLLCGGCTFLILSARYYVHLTPEFGMDGREILLVVGAALAGPWGAVIMNILMAIGVKIGAPSAPIAGSMVDVTIHLIGTILFAILYKKVLYEKIRQPYRLLGWALLVPVYYWILVAPVATTLYYAIGMARSLFYILMLPIWPEVIVTTIITTLVMAALPEKWRKPLWGSPGRPEIAQSVAGMP